MGNAKNVVIFDFDGVISVSDDARFKILKEQALRYNVVISDSLYKATIGQTTVNFFQKHFSHLNPDTIHNIIENYTKIYRSNILQYSKEVNPVTSFIKKHSTEHVFAIASTNTIVNIRAVLKKFGIINHFSCIVTREDVLEKKPNPSAYLKVINKLNVHKSQCIAVEDSAIGAQAAINAGIPVIGLLNGSNTVHDFDDLPLADVVSKETELADAIHSYKNHDTHST
jgi:HAD hydrolase, family IA, variant 3